jgi:hypothetical protein
MLHQTTLVFKYLVVHADPICVHITLINSSSDPLMSSLGTVTCTRGSSVYTLPQVASTSPEMSSLMNQSFLFPPCILLLAATTPMSDSLGNNAAANPSNTLCYDIVSCFGFGCAGSGSSRHAPGSSTSSGAT